MIRRFNYTGRVKIPKSRINISLFKDDDGKYFTASVDLNGLRFPSYAKVYIEPNYKGVYQRFFFGTVDNFIQPESTRINELPDTELAYFDISVVDEQSEIGLLLGKARGVAVSTDGFPNDRIPLLPVNTTDLKNQFWKLSFDSSDDGRPILELNRNIPEVTEMARNDIKFISLIYPAAFRGVLEKIIEYGDVDINDEDSWIVQWKKFIVTFLGIKTAPEFNSNYDGLTAEQEEWVDNCVNEYCKKKNLFEKFIAK